MAESTPSEQEMFRAAIGERSTEFYERHLAANKTVSWNWPAFFVTGYWMLYRKLWIEALVYLFVLPVVVVLISAEFFNVLGEDLGTLLYAALYLGLIFCIVPMYANALYANKIRRLVRKAKARQQDTSAQLAWLAKHGGTSAIWVFLIVMVALIGILAAVALPAYQDYVENANTAKVQAHYDEATRFVDNELRRVQAELAMGITNVQVLDSQGWDANYWATELNASGATSPTGKAGFADHVSDADGVVGIHVEGSFTGSSYSVTLTRPRYGAFADSEAARSTIRWPRVP